MKIPKLLLAIGVAGLAMVSSQAQTFTGTDVGAPATAGSHTINGDTITITGGGADIWGTADQFYYYYTTVTGGFDAWINVQSLSGPNEWTKCEIMARWAEGGVPAAGDPHVSQTTTPDTSNTPAGVNLIQPQWRTSRGGDSGNTDDFNVAPVYPNVWMRLKRSGQTWELFRSTDGADWGEPYYTITTTDWPDEVLLGIAVTSHDNGAGQLGTAVTSPITFNVNPTIAATGNALGSKIQVFDSQVESVTGITQVLLDGTDITSDTVINKTSTTTTIDYDILAATGGYFASGSTHNVEVTYTSGAGGGTLSTDFTTKAYLVVPTDLKSTTPTGTDGEMNLHVSQYDQPRQPNANSLAGLEQQLAGAMRDVSGNIMPNVAPQPDATINDYPWEVNYNALGGGNINETDPQPDHFNINVLNPEYDNIDVSPFISSDVNSENFVFEFYGYIQLDAGFYTMGVNSDDGFKLSIGKSPRDIFGVVVGEFNGGRGAALNNPTFDFMIEESGAYPFRLLWGQGNGGGNCEWYNVMADGSMLLINDPTENPAFGGTWSDSLYTWSGGGSSRAAVTKLVPANGYVGVDPTDSIEWVITSGTASSVVNGQTTLIIDGVEVITGGGATGTYTPAEEMMFGSEHTGQLIWTESPDIVHTEDFTFTVRTEGMQDLGWGFWFGLADYDFEGGQTLASASVMEGSPYLGGEYAVASGPYPPIIGIDWSGDQNVADGWTYRASGTNDLYDPSDNHQPDGTTPDQPINRTRKAANQVVTVPNSYKLGWAGGYPNRWYNYTRNVPVGIYKAFGVFSSDNTANVLGGDLGMVTSGQGTDTQTTKTFGSFAGAGSDGWGNGIWIPLRTSFDVAAKPAYFKITETTPTTFRFWSRNGDMHFVQLTQVTGDDYIAPQVIATPAEVNYAIMRNSTIDLEWQVEEFTSAVVETSVMVEFGLQGAMADVTADATITRSGDIVTVSYSYVPTGLMEAGMVYEYKLTAVDDNAAATEITDSGTRLVSYLPSDSGDLVGEGAFLIEVEDFNYDSGMVMAAANTMPYTGSAYDGLTGIMGIDYSRDDAVDYTADGQFYRLFDTNTTPAGVTPVVAGNDGADTLRNVRDMSPDGTVTWNVDNNYKIGWSGSPPNRWYNYTRQIPAGAYTVWAGMAVDSTAPSSMRSQLEQVVSGATTDQQVTVQLGVFDGGGTGTWGDTVLIPLLNNTTDREIKTISITGTSPTTLRWIMDSGDQDYLMLVPAGDVVTGPIIESITPDGSGNLDISWTGAGMLQSAASIPAGGWTDVTDVSPATVPVPSSGEAYYRVMGN